MKIAIVSHFYPPEPCAAATRVASLEAALSAAGHEVTVITNFPSFPQGRYADGSGTQLLRIERAAGRHVVRLRSLLARRLPAKRLVHWVSSAVAAGVYLAMTRTAYDVVVVSMPPITLALPALLGAFRHRARLVVDVRDVFPDIAIAMGQWKPDGFAARLSEWVVRRVYRRADLIVAVTPTALSQIAARGVDGTRLALARNAAEQIDGAARAVPSRSFTAIYAGNLGLATDVDLLLDAAKRVDADRITLRIVGDGALRAYVAERVTREGIRNVALCASVPRFDAMRELASAHVAVVPLRKGIEESVPTKLYDALAVGTPVIVAAAGEARREALDLHAFTTPPGDAEALAAVLTRLSLMDSEELRAVGEAGRRRLQQRADRASVMVELAGRISALA